MVQTYSFSILIARTDNRKFKKGKREIKSTSRARYAASQRQIDCSTKGIRKEIQESQRNDIRCSYCRNRSGNGKSQIRRRMRRMFG